MANYDMTITTGKRITITWDNGGFAIRNGNLKNFAWDTAKQLYYFNMKHGTSLSYDFMLKHSDLATVAGSAAGDFATVLATILAELDAED